MQISREIRFRNDAENSVNNGFWVETISRDRFRLDEEELIEKNYDWDAIIAEGPQFQYEDKFGRRNSTFFSESNSTFDFFLSKRFFSERFVFREKERRRDLVTSRHVTAESLALKFDFTDRSNPVSFFFSIEVKTSTRKFPFSLQIETRRSSFVEFFLRRTEFARTS